MATVTPVREVTTATVSLTKREAQVVLSLLWDGEDTQARIRTRQANEDWIYNLINGLEDFIVA